MPREYGAALVSLCEGFSEGRNEVDYQGDSNASQKRVSSAFQESEDWSSIHGMRCLCLSMKDEHYCIASIGIWPFPSTIKQAAASYVEIAILKTTPWSTCREVKE